MKKLDYEIAKKCLEHLTKDFDGIKVLGNDPDAHKILVLSSSQYQKYVLLYGEDEGALAYSSDADYPYGIDLSTGEIVFYQAMRGHKVFFNAEIDIHIHLFQERDILIRTKYKQ